MADDESATVNEGYFPAEALSRKPEPLAPADVDFSNLDGEAPGRMVLDLWIDSAGSVVAVETASSTVSERVSARILAAFHKMRFAAGEIAGNAVPAVIRIEVDFD